MKVWEQYFGQNTASEVNYLFTIFTGGRVDTPSLVGLGIAAYINASIIMQILPYAIPRLKELQKEGERGRQVINQITRFITFPLSIFYSIVYLYLIAQRDLANPANDPSIAADPTHIVVNLIPNAPGMDTPTLQKILFMAIILTAGTIFLMWLSELVTERGLGNGSSLIITIGILATLPGLISQDFSQTNIPEFFNQIFQGNFSVLNNSLSMSLVAVIVGAVIVIAGIVFISESIRKIPIQYARRVRGAEIGKGSSLPLKFTLTGVLPIIFTYGILSVPQLILPFLENGRTSGRIFDITQSLRNSFLFAQTDQVVDGKDTTYAIVYFFIVIAFALLYAFIVLNPEETAENLQKSGAFVPGIRPGKSTEAYITSVLLKISLVGGVFLALIAEVPILASNLVASNTGVNLALLSGIGGTSVLIVVGVLLDTYRQYKSIQASRNYEKYILN